MLHIKLPRAAFLSAGSGGRRTAAAKRKIVLGQLGKDVLARLGYDLGDSLRVPGGYAFGATHDGVPVKVGIKTATYRWLGTSRGVLEKVERVFVISFRFRQGEEDVPTHFEMFEFDPRVIEAKIDFVEAELKRQGRDYHVYLPLDPDEAAAKPHELGAQAGALIPDGRRVFEAPVSLYSGEVALIVDDDDDEVAADPASPSAPEDLAALVQQVLAGARKDVADRLGVPLSAVKLEVTFS